MSGYDESMAALERNQERAARQRETERQIVFAEQEQLQHILTLLREKRDSCIADDDLHGSALITELIQEIGPANVHFQTHKLCENPRCDQTVLKGGSVCDGGCPCDRSYDNGLERRT